MRLFLILFLFKSINLTSLGINNVRDKYKEAAQDNSKIETFNKLLSKVSNKDDVALVAYKGAGIILLAINKKK